MVWVEKAFSQISFGIYNQNFKAADAKFPVTKFNQRQITIKCFQPVNKLTRKERMFTYSPLFQRKMAYTMNCGVWGFLRKF